MTSATTQPTTTPMAAAANAIMKLTAFLANIDIILSFKLYFKPLEKNFAIC
jgi:hypothetical protein